MFFGFVTLKPGSVGKQRHKLPRRYMVTDTSPVGAEAEHWRGVHSQFVANHPHRSRGARHWRRALAKWELQARAERRWHLEYEAELEGDATRAWQSQVEFEESSRDLKAQLAGCQLQVQALSVQREKAVEDSRYWYGEVRNLTILVNQRADQLAAVRKGVEDMSQTLAEQAKVTAEQLAEIQDRWQRSEDQRFAAVEQCVALERLIEQASEAVGKAGATAARHVKAFRRGMRIAKTRIEGLGAKLTQAEMVEEAAQNWNATLLARNVNLLAYLAPEGLPPTSLAGMLFGLRKVELAVLQLATEQGPHLEEVPGTDTRPWLSRLIQDEMAIIQQLAGSGAPRESRELTQAEQCQACGRDRAEWEGFVRGDDGAWRCGPCSDRLQPTDDIAVRLSGHRSTAGEIDLLEIQRAEPVATHQLGCDTCESWQLSGHAEPCASCEEQDGGKGSNWFGFAVLSVVLSTAHKCTAPEDASPERLPMRPELGPCGMAGICELPLGHYGDHKARTSTWTNEMREEFRRKLLTNTTDGHLSDSKPVPQSARDLLPAVDEQAEHTEYQFQPTDRDYRGLTDQASRVDAIKLRLDALNNEATARLVEQVKEDDDLAKWFIDTATGLLIDTGHLSADSSGLGPIDCTYEQSRAPRSTQRSRSGQTARRQQENKGVSAVGRGSAEGRTCDEELPNGSEQAVTEALSETACQNMAKRLASQSPGRVTSGWLDKALDILSRAGRLSRTEDLALRILVKRPKGRE